MDPTPSSAPETPAPLTRRTNPALTRRFTRRASTFALGGLVGALGVALVIVVTSIIATPRDESPLVPAEPAPVAETRTTPRPSPTSTPTPTVSPTAEAPEETTDAATDDAVTPPVADTEPSPEPAPSEQPAEEDEASSTGPGRSGSAPGQTKDPKKP
ncbi:hypothetical protein ACFT30_12900 [Microbacterium ureisolvens]|uniref:hypothetical protein n=1 Tax=Microbacterium ureisolvens TaxID=2781186 RepID=UPI00362A1D2F